MGINDLCSVIESEAPGVVTSCHLSTLNGFYLAVDISIFLYKYIRTAGGDMWMNVFISFLCKFIKHNIVTVCIFDGPNPPIEKKLEQVSRREQVAKSIDKLEMMIDCRRILQEDYLDDDTEIPDELIERVKNLLRSPVKPDTTNYNSVYSIIDNLSDKIEKLKNQTVAITQDHRDTAFRIIQLMGLHAIQADGEAEALCCHLAREGIVHGVLTEDTDCLVYGAPFTFTFKNFTLSDEQVVVYHLSSILDAMEMDHATFVDMCIMLKCDYNRYTYRMGTGVGVGNAPGSSTDQPPPQKETTKIRGRMPDEDGNPITPKKTPDIAIGTKKVVELIKRFRTFAEASKYLTNPEVLKYERCKEIFTTFPPLPFTTMFKRNLQPDVEALEKLIRDRDVYVNFALVRSMTLPTPVKFCDEDSLSSLSSSDDDVQDGEDGEEREDGVPQTLPEPKPSLLAQIKKFLDEENKDVY